MNGTTTFGTKLFFAFILCAVGLTAEGAIYQNKITTTNDLRAVSVFTNLDNDSFLNSRASLLPGETYSNLNRFSWTNTMGLISEHRQFTVLLVGDGLMGEGLGTSTAFNFLTNYFPVAGWLTPFGSYWFPSITSSSNATAVASGDPTAVGGWSALTGQNGQVTFSSSFYPNGFPADFGAVWYVEEPGANIGRFLVETQLNGGTWGTVNYFTNVVATGANPVGKIITWTNASVQPMQIRVTQLNTNGTVRILGASVRNRGLTNGFNLGSWTGSSSVTWSNTLGTNVNITAPLFKFFNPSLVLSDRITWDIENGASGAAGDSTTNFQKYLDLILTNTPQADLVLMGNYPSLDVNGADAQSVITNNYRMWTNALNRGLAYFDGWSPLINTVNMTNRGWLTAASNPHMTPATPAGYAPYDILFSRWLALPSATPGRQRPYGLQLTPEFLFDADFKGNQFYTIGNALPTNGTNYSFLDDMSPNSRSMFDVARVGGADYWTNNLTMLAGYPWLQLPALSAFQRNEPYTLAQPFTVYCVVNFAAFTDNHALLWSTNVLAGNPQTVGVVDGDIRSGGTTLTYTAQTGVWYIMKCVFNGASSSVTTNGVIAVSGDAGNGTLNGITIGAAGDLTAKFNGSLAWLAIYPRVLTTKEDIQLLSYLNNRYAVFDYPSISAVPLAGTNSLVGTNDSRNLTLSGTFVGNLNGTPGQSLLQNFYGVMLTNNFVALSGSTALVQNVFCSLTNPVMITAFTPNGVTNCSCNVTQLVEGSRLTVACTNNSANTTSALTNRIWVIQIGGR